MYLHVPKMSFVMNAVKEKNQDKRLENEVTFLKLVIKNISFNSGRDWNRVKN